MSFSNQVFKNTTTGQLFDIFTSPQTDIIPAQDLTYDLGSPNKRWENVYTGSIILGGGGLSLNYYNTTTLNINIDGDPNVSTTVNLVRLGNIVFGFIVGFAVNLNQNYINLPLVILPLDFTPSGNQSQNFTYFATISGSTNILHCGQISKPGGIARIILLKNISSPFSSGDALTVQNINFTYIV